MLLVKRRKTHAHRWPPSKPPRASPSPSPTPPHSSAALVPPQTIPIPRRLQAVALASSELPRQLVSCSLLAAAAAASSSAVHSTRPLPGRPPAFCSLQG
ncbi:hypothetical protein PVAP13_2KG176458 [Panicum virgatum]|uniref:Uncharacterized protein n=1 Tax=Panicum virgatum TaxID=38727 RepID=A0A8T0W426_PANVG|nr:hypothetical protein PVAP13_2KG176458 [Panicum virgatum]